MKRSEVVKLIAEDFKKMDFLSFEEDPLPMDTYLNDADAILSKLEDLGMLPPQRNADLESRNGYAQVWEWEKE